MSTGAATGSYPNHELDYHRSDATLELEEFAVETLLLSHVTSKASAIQHRTPWYRRYLRIVFAFLYRTSRKLLKLTILCILAILVLAYTIAAYDYLSMPSFCRRPRMEVYHGTSHCGRAQPPGGTLPPTPIYWVDFQTLGDLQSRLVETFWNASVVHRNSSGQSVRYATVELEDEYRALGDLERHAHWVLYDFKISDILHRMWNIGLNFRLGFKELPRRYGRSSAWPMVLSNKLVADGIEKAIAKQPKTLSAKAMAWMLPRLLRDDIWYRDPDMEVNWRFHKASISIWEKTDELILKLEEYLQKITKHKEYLDALAATNDKNGGTPPASPSPAANIAPPKVDEPAALWKNIYDCIDRLREETQALSDRMDWAIAGLRTIRQEVDDLRQKTAKPVVTPIPLYVHLRHVYVAGERLARIDRDIKAEWAVARFRA
ncbi:hypothetical protein NMY22_g13410 [Coprinellus aureogranulatus]|nr:hypothetical protein NMY22_g13410 [Coprinellus aureogranulatus]